MSCYSSVFEAKRSSTIFDLKHPETPHESSKRPINESSCVYKHLKDLLDVLKVKQEGSVSIEESDLLILFVSTFMLQHF